MTEDASSALRDLWRQSRFEARRRLRWPVAGRFQPYAHTLPDRYPWLFGFARDALLGVELPRLLSFGCSRGDEVFSLCRRLPAATIKGLDINPANIAACRARAQTEGNDRIAFEVAASVAAEPSEHYHAIFCLAVLCHGDLTASGARRSEPLMRFQDFDRMVAEFARCLAPGGLLFLHATNFRFCDTTAAPAFETALTAAPDQLGTDVLFDRSGRLLPNERYHPVGFRKRVASR